MYHDDHAHLEFRVNRGFNPEFVKRARANERRREMERREQEKRNLTRRARTGKMRRMEDVRITKLLVQMEANAEKRFSNLIKTLEGRRSKRAEVRIPVEDIIATAAEKHGVTVHDIKGQSRRKWIVAARFEAIAQAYQLRPDLSLARIGEAFGGRDHTTLISALRKMKLK